MAKRRIRNIAADEERVRKRRALEEHLADIQLRLGNRARTVMQKGKPVQCFTYAGLIGLRADGVIDDDVIVSARTKLVQERADGKWHVPIFRKWKLILEALGFFQLRFRYRGLNSDDCRVVFAAGHISFVPLVEFLAKTPASSPKLPEKTRVAANYWPYVAYRTRWKATPELLRMVRTKQGNVKRCLSRGSIYFLNEAMAFDEPTGMTFDCAEDDFVTPRLIEKFETQARTLRIRLCNAMRRDLRAGYQEVISDASLIADEQRLFTATGGDLQDQEDLPTMGKYSADVQTALDQVEEIVRLIDEDVPDSAHDRAGDFFETVREKTISVGETIKKIGRVTESQQSALNSWESGVKKWIH